MKIRRWFLSLLVCLFLPVAVMATSTETPSVELDHLLNSAKTFQANFSQITISENNQRLKTSSGVMQFERPEKFRWETLKPAHQIVITDGKYLWTYDVALKQATKQKINTNMLTPANVLSGHTAALLKKFNITVSQAGNRKQFLLVAKNNDENFKTVMIYFEAGKLSGLTVVNQLGQKNRFDFTDMKVNQPLDKSLFAFKAPNDVDVLQSK